jgi:hypothetical protein
MVLHYDGTWPGRQASGIAAEKSVSVMAITF